MEAINVMFEQLRTSAENYVKALQELAKAEMDRMQNEAKMIEWLNSAAKTALNSLKGFLTAVKSLSAGLRSEAASMHTGDADYYQRLFLTQKAQLNAMFDADGNLLSGITQERLSEVVEAYREAASGLRGALPEYETGIKGALERALLQTADMLDFAHEVLSVHIVADDTARNTIGDMLGMINGALDLSQIGFSGTSDSVKRALALASGAKTQEELNSLIEAIATLRYGDETSDMEYLGALGSLAEYDSQAGRMIELLTKAVSALDRQNELGYEQLKNLAKTAKAQERAEYESQSA